MDKLEGRILHLNINWNHVLIDFSRLFKFDYVYNTTGMAHARVPLSEINPNFISWLLNLGLEIKLAESFYCAPGGTIPVHSDEVDPPGCCKLNWAYCDETVMLDWYDSSPDVSLEYRDNSIGGYYLTCDPENYSISSSSIIRTPSIVQVSDLHGVTNDTNSPWYCFCLVLRRHNSTAHRISWNDAVDIFKEYSI